VGDCTGLLARLFVLLRGLSCVFPSRGSSDELFRSTLLSYPADFGYRANVLATSLDIN
jgi:hypothetical protein